MVDELAVLATPAQLWSVGGHYADFRQVSDNEVIKYLHSAHDAMRNRSGRSSGLPLQPRSYEPLRCV